MEVMVSRERCVGCGSCARDCLQDLLVVKNGRAEVQEGVCIRCGHCVAVCPADAVRLAGCLEEEIRPYDPAAFAVPAENLLNFMRFRRSIRQFRDRPVEDEKVNALLEAARYSPTGGNRQMTRYILLTGREQAEVTELALRTLRDAADQAPKRYQVKWRNMYEAWRERGEDRLFYHAPCVLLTVARDPEGSTGRLDAGLASANMELLANAMGLGVCYIGFFTRAAALESALGRRLGLRDGEELVSVLAVGYPAVTYYRTVDRDAADLTRLSGPQS